MRLTFEGHEFTLAGGETVLDCLDRHDAGVASFCRNGVCQSCVVRAENGDVPAAAQKGLKEAWRAQGWFLACQCRPTSDMVVARCDAARDYRADVLEVQSLSERVLRVRLSRPSGFDYAAGQFVQLRRPADGLMRPYSLASTPADPYLELHVAALPDGRMSGWLSGAQGQAVGVRGPFGECFYVPEARPRPLLLAGTGTGLAPLWGVLQTALAAGHAAPVRLLHAASARAELYLWSVLESLSAEHPQLACTGSVPDCGDVEGMSGRTLEQLSMETGLPLAEARIYLCGNPVFVRNMRRQLYLAGAALDRIHADPFLPPTDRSNS